MNEVYKAVYDRLNDQLSTPVYDHVPQDTNNFPYTRLDALRLNDNDTDLELGYSGTVQIITFSRYRGTKEVADINLAIYNALHRHVFGDTANYGISTLTQEFSNIVVEPDGLTRQSIQQFNIIFEKI